MEFNGTPSGERVHIAIFGRRNAGKSSMMNAVTNQEIAVVSKIKGTTTDPVYKTMELLPLGPVVLIDTPGLDDEGDLGRQRMIKTRQVLRKTDAAIVVVDPETGFTSLEQHIVKELEERKLPYIIAVNKTDVNRAESETLIDKIKRENAGPVIAASTKSFEGIDLIKETLTKIISVEEKKYIVRDLINPMDIVILVVPVDESAPKGRLILPQQQTIRELLESGAIAVVVKDTEYKETLKKIGEKPKLVITDSQVFGQVAKETPKDISLTSFSILFSRYKGDLEEQLKGIEAVERLKDKDRVLMAEGCTHHRQCSDIGTVKIPRWLTKHTGKNLIFRTSSGTAFPDELKDIALVVHCGGCMLNEKEMRYRIKTAKEQKVPIVNYGILIAYLKGILSRSLEPLKGRYNDGGNHSE